MSRLIDADKWLEERRAESILTSTDWGHGYECGRDDMIESIAVAPTVDAVPVMRCRECKYYQPGKHFTDINFCQRLPLYAEKGGLNVSDDDFCSRGEYGYGERREVDGDDRC